MTPNIGPVELILVALVCGGALIVPIALFAAMFAILQRQKRIEEKLDRAGEAAQRDRDRGESG